MSRFIKELHSAGRTYDLKLWLKCGHTLERSTKLGEDQTKADYLFLRLVEKAIDKTNGKTLPEKDFNITCSLCKTISKFTEVQYMDLSFSNNLVES